MAERRVDVNLLLDELPQDVLDYHLGVGLHRNIAYAGVMSFNQEHRLQALGNRLPRRVGQRVVARRAQFS